MNLVTNTVSPQLFAIFFKDLLVVLTVANLGGTGGRCSVQCYRRFGDHTSHLNETIEHWERSIAMLQSPKWVVVL